MALARRPLLQREPHEHPDTPILPQPRGHRHRQLFAILANARLAGDIHRLRTGEPLAADVPPSEVRDVEVPVEKIIETRVEVPVEKIVERRVEVATDTAALQLLGLLQREARFVDFIQGGRGAHSDAEIGAAARGAWRLPQAAGRAFHFGARASRGRGQPRHAGRRL